MKKLVLTALAMACAVGVFAQGTVIFNNRVVGTVVTHVYLPLASNPSLSTVGNGAGDTPAGTVNWSSYTPVGSASYLAQLLAANGANQAESSLVAASSPATTFRTGAAAGFINTSTATLTGVPGDSPAATLEMVAWDNSSGNYPTWALASVAWQAGLIAAGKSGAFNVTAIGGTLNPAPTLNNLQSFNLTSTVPEPSSFALAGLGAAALLIFRRRK